MPRPRRWLAAAALAVAAPAALTVLLAAQALASPSAAAAARPGPVGDALSRPAMMVRAPHRVVLMAAAQAGQRIVAVGERGVIALSDDQGASWRQAPCPVSVTLTMVRFADERHGMAVGHGGSVLATSDAGASWQLLLDGRRAAALVLAQASTPEARREAERLVADGPDKPWLDLLMWDARRLLVVGAYGLALYSEDGGQQWVSWMGRLPNPRALHWYVARRAGDSLLLAGEQGLVVRSDDGGQSFRALNSPYAGSWFTGRLQADGSVLLAGLRGQVWRSADGGTQWQAWPTPVAATITALTETADGRLLLASQAGLVLQQQGDALVPLAAPPVPMPAGLLALRQGGLLSLGVAGVVPVPMSAQKPAAGARP